MGYTFKSTGRTLQKYEEQKIEPTVSIPYGIVTPLREGSDEIFATHKTVSGFIKDNFKNLLQTNYGTRLMRQSYGANILPLVFEYTTDDKFDEHIKERISRAVGKWMPYILLKDYGISFPSEQEVINTGVTYMKIIITYDVPSISVYDEVVELNLRCILYGELNVKYCEAESERDTSTSLSCKRFRSTTINNC